jgi:hypothetical protein
MEKEDISTNQKKQQVSRRSVSMPSIYLESPQLKRSPLSKFSKRSFTLGLGEQRDLQGRIVATFREYDQKFTNISRSGILLSSQDLSRLSNESLDKSILPSEMSSTEDLFNSATSLNYESPNLNYECHKLEKSIDQDSSMTKNKPDRKERRRHSDTNECRIL